MAFFFFGHCEPFKFEYIICNHILEPIRGHWPLYTYTPHLFTMYYAKCTYRDQCPGAKLSQPAPQFQT